LLGVQGNGVLDVLFPDSVRCNMSRVPRPSGVARAA
jgi:hypothetical protein